MKPIASAFRAKSSLVQPPARVLALLALMHLLAGPAQARDLTAALGEPYYTGRIIPTPRECRLLSSELPLADAAERRARAAILLTANAPAVHWGAETFARRVSRAAELPGFPISQWDGLNLPSGSDAYIAVGLVGDPALSRLPGYDSGWERQPKPEGYHIRPTHIAGRPALLVAATDGRGAAYAMASLAQLVRARGDRIVLRACEIDDWPEFAIRSLSHAQPGEHLIPFAHWMAGYKLNQLTINYYENWQRTKPYYYAAMEALGRDTRSTGIFDLGQIVNPYDPRYHPDRYKIRVSKDEDVERLIQQFRISLDSGCRFIMLATDDHVDIVNGEFALTDSGDRLRFFDLADAHVFLGNKVYRTLKPDYPGMKMAFCTSYYSTRHEEFTRSPAIGWRYLRKLGRGLDPEIGIVWTGPAVTSFSFTDQDIDYYEGVVGRKMMLWDNTTVRASTWRFLPFTGDRFPPDLAERSFARGFYLNMRAFDLYKAFCVTVGDYLWNPKAYSGERSIRTALRSIYGEDGARALQAWGRVYNQILDVRSEPNPDPERLARLIAELSGLRDRVAQHVPALLSVFDGDVSRQRKELEALTILPSLACPAGRKSPDLDGVISPGEWEGAVAFPPFQDSTGAGVTVCQTTARMFRTEDALYFAFECAQDPKVRHAPPVTEHDSGIFLGDVVEVFLDPGRTRSGHYHFAVSSNGTRFDMERRGLGLGITHWNPEWQAATRQGESGWTAEVKIPFAAVGNIPQPGSVWGLNPCRGYYEAGQTSCWSPTLGRFSNHQFYGACRF